MKTALFAISNGLILLAASVPAVAVVLYNGLSTPSQTPAQQGWVYLATPFPTAPSATATSSGTVLDTGDIKNQAGYFRQSPSALNRLNGYTINFTVQINSENHGTNTNRAGFSVLVMSDRLSSEKQPYGIELGFWQNSIWAQNTGFTRGESVSFNTQAAWHNYKLKVVGSSYQLFVDGSATPILQGSLRQYTGYTPPPGYPNPYTTPNLIFLGDNTTSAKAKVTVKLVDVN